MVTKIDCTMKYFTVSELTASDVARQENIDNTPPPGVRVKLSNLIHGLLDPIREKWGGPITVNSGYRCPLLNKAVGGVPTSQTCAARPPALQLAAPKINVGCSI